MSCAPCHFIRRRGLPISDITQQRALLPFPCLLSDIRLAEKESPGQGWGMGGRSTASSTCPALQDDIWNHFRVGSQNNWHVKVSGLVSIHGDKPRLFEGLRWPRRPAPCLWQVKEGPTQIPRCRVKVGLPREWGDHRLDGPQSAEWIKLFMFPAIYCGLLRADCMRLTHTLTWQIVGSSRTGLDHRKRKAAEASHGCLRARLSPLVLLARPCQPS